MLKTTTPSWEYERKGDRMGIGQNLRQGIKKLDNPVKRSLKEDMDSEITYDDDISIDLGSPSTRGGSRSITEILESIESKLDKIEHKLNSHTSASDVFGGNTAIPPTDTLSESLMSFNNGNLPSGMESRLRAPSNVVPKGTMLEEIQSVLAQTVPGSNPAESAGENIVSSICTLPTSAYDDDIPEIVKE